MVQRIRTEGWTPEDLHRACEAAARAVAEPGDEDAELAAEFMRWFREGCRRDIDGVVDLLNEWKPISSPRPHLDDLYTILVDEHATADLVSTLKERYPDPETTLIALLDEVIPDRGADRDSDSDPDATKDLAQAHRTAFVALLLLNTTRGTEYVLRRLRYFDWSHASLDATRVEAFPGCGEAARAATVRLWPTMSWSQRESVLAFLCAHQLYHDEMLALLTNVALETLSHEDLVAYIETLWQVSDPRTKPRVQEIVAWALYKLDTGSAEAKAIVGLMFDLFGDPAPYRWLTDEQYDRIDVLLVPHKRVGPIEIRRIRGIPHSWFANGPVPLAVALELYEDVVGRRDLMPPPAEIHVAWYTAEGVRVLPTKYQDLMPPGPVKLHDRPSEIASGFMLGYDIGSEAGLQLFESVLRKHGIDRALTPSWWKELDGRGA